MNIILEKSFQFAVKTGKLCIEIQKSQKEFEYTRQLKRSSSSVGACVTEAQDAESKKDFIHKLSIALKEAKESRYWLQILKELELIHHEDFSNQIDEIIKILTSILISSKQSS